MVFEHRDPSSDGASRCLPEVEREQETGLPARRPAGGRRLVEQALAADPGQLGDAQVRLDTRALFELADRVQALGVRCLAEVDRRGLHRLDDSPTTTACARAQVLPVSGAHIALARRLDALTPVQLEERARRAAESAELSLHAE